jgi:hypothetical protein
LVRRRATVAVNARLVEREQETTNRSDEPCYRANRPRGAAQEADEASARRIRVVHGIFQKAIRRRNAVAAVAAADELPQLSLVDALELTLLLARKDPRRHPRVAARWLQRYLEEDPGPTIEEAALAASSLVALSGVGYREAAQTLQAMAERAIRRRRAEGIA